MKEWKCTVCGYIHKGETPPAKCPVCGADKSKFVLLGANGSVDQAAAPIDVIPEKVVASGTVTKWKCSVCGYIHNGPEPPAKCPVCGADKSKFIPLEEEPSKASIVDQTTETEETEPVSGNSKVEDLAERFAPFLGHPIAKNLTRLHGHPIAVHIPNGVLPLTILFTLLASVFHCDALALAATCNMVFVFLATPIVILTGLIDWNNRFNARMSSVFQIKMICAAIVCLLSLIIAVWWIVQPEVYLGDSPGISLFIILNILDLAAAGVAGWYGGKLVFPNN